MRNPLRFLIRFFCRRKVECVSNEILLLEHEYGFVPQMIISPKYPFPHIKGMWCSKGDKIHVRIPQHRVILTLSVQSKDRLWVTGCDAEGAYVLLADHTERPARPHEIQLDKKVYV